MNRFLYVLLLIGLGGKSVDALADWRHVGHRDIYEVIVIGHEDVTTTRIYWDALRSVCRQKSYCNVIFFGTNQWAPTKSKKRFSDDELTQSLLVYTKSSGFEWNCRFRPEADNCFK